TTRPQHAGAHRRALALIRAEAQETDGGMIDAHLLHEGDRVVVAAVIDHDDFVGVTTGLEVGDDLAQVARKPARFVESGNDDRPAGAGAAHACGMGSVRRRRRAVPVWCAARATASATAGATALLNTLGMMYSSLSSLRLTQPAMARAAASFISSLTARARESRSPRNSPGKHST